MTDALGVMGDEWLGYLWLVAVLIVIPTVLGRLMRASWREIGFAFAVVVAISALFALTSHQESWKMTVAWTAIGFMILALPGVPIVLFVLRLFRRRGSGR